MPIIRIPNGGTVVTEDPKKYTPISDTWSVSSYGTGYAVLSADNGTGNAIAELVQGAFVSSTGGTIVTPSMFGGITPNNDANQYAQVISGQYSVTTTMPNQQAPLVNYVYCLGSFILEVLHVIDNNTIVVKDPSGISQLSSGYTITGFSANTYNLTNITIYNDASSSCLVWLPGQIYAQLGAGTTNIEQNNYGECLPVMITCNAGATILTYNE